MCNHHERVTWECRGDGYLWDADYDGWDPEDVSFPCPKCNTVMYLRSNLEDKENQDDPETFWADVVNYARKVSMYNVDIILENIHE